MTQTVVTNEVRLSWPKLERLEAQMPGGRETVSTVVLVPETDTETIDALRGILNEAVQARWGDKPPSGLRNPLRQGSADRYPEQEGCLTFNAKAGRLIPIVGTDNVNLTPDRISAEVYGGQRARVAVNAYAYDSHGNRGVAFGLVMVQILGGGERLGGGAPSAESLFGPAKSASTSASSQPANPWGGDLI